MTRVRKGSRVLGFFSAKGGVGKTTLTANVGASLACTFGRSVCLVDANVTAANLGLHFGLYYPPVSLRDVLKKRIPAASAIYVHSSGVRILPSPLSLDGIDVDVESIKRVIGQLGSYDFVILDSPPTLGADTGSVLGLVDEAIIVATPDLPAVTDAAKMIQLAARSSVKVGGLVLNRVREKKYEMRREDIESICGTKIIAEIHEDDNVQKSMALGQPAVLAAPHCRASNEINALAARLCGVAYERGFLQTLRKFMNYEVAWFRQKPRPQKAAAATLHERPAGQEISAEEAVAILRDEIRKSVSRKLKEKVSG